MHSFCGTEKHIIPVHSSLKGGRFSAAQGCKELKVVSVMYYSRGSSSVIYGVTTAFSEAKQATAEV